MNQLDDFTRAYINCALWSSTVDPFGDCPQCGAEDKILCRWDENQKPVCDSCSDREPSYEPRADENYGIEDLDDAAIERMVLDCQKFQADNAEWIVDENLSHGPVPSREHEGMYGSTERAGRDFWLTRCGHGAGFWDGDWTEPAATKLTESSESFGNCDLYVGDDGKLYIT